MALTRAELTNELREVMDYAVRLSDAETVSGGLPVYAASFVYDEDEKLIVKEILPAITFKGYKMKNSCGPTYTLVAAADALSALAIVNKRLDTHKPESSFDLPELLKG